MGHDHRCDRRKRGGAGMTPHELRALRWTLAAVWLVTGIVVLWFYPLQDSLKLVARVGLTGAPALAAVYLGGLLDVVMGVLTLFWGGRWLWRAQAALIVGYTLIISVFLPEFWLHPFGPILKNLPILCLLWLLHRHPKDAL
jgi:hypothetical protein